MSLFCIFAFLLGMLYIQHTWYIQQYSKFVGKQHCTIIKVKLDCHIGFNTEALNYNSYPEVRDSNALTIIEILSPGESWK